jgi:3-mercaptopyruvate sulfurtransferase SseA
VVLQLINMGYKKVFALKGGWKAWEAAGYPTEEK